MDTTTEAAIPHIAPEAFAERAAAIEREHPEIVEIQRLAPFRSLTVISLGRRGLRRRLDVGGVKARVCGPTTRWRPR